jgi:hypothetical protein
MPTYKNNTGNTITHNSRTWAPGDTHSVNFSVPRERGLTVVSEEPRLVGGTLAGGRKELAPDETFEIYIKECSDFFASIMAKSGSAVVCENYQDNDEACPIDSGTNYFRERASTTHFPANVPNAAIL